ncbi:MAG: hypothetical protein BWY69_00699 [Planctomycetes bacterium ADurb.Bin401]|nr:MAG: hypothetical protein BWY69_00699 [Planctomycetes bacterium ADurb.Bin401]
MYNNSIELSVAEPDFYTDFGISNAQTYDELWAVAGEDGNSTGPGSGVAQIRRAIDPWYHSQLHLGESYAKSGTVIYHFITDDYFSGGTVTIDADYRGGTAHMWLGTSSVEPTGAGTPQTPSYWSTFNWTPYQTKMLDQYWSRVDYSVNIPAGKEFWVAISKPLSSDPEERSVYAQVMSVSVQANVTADPVCSNPVIADLNKDCKVNLKDFAVIGENWANCSDPDNPAECPGTFGLDGWEI